MQWLIILPGYLLWHYSRAYRDLIHVWGNLVWFVLNVFAIPRHLFTLLAPWHRMLEPRTGRFDIEAWAERVVVNIMSRIIGLIVRVVVIIAGLVSLLTTGVAGLALLIVWAALPLLPALFLLLGVTFLI